jgi:hypothetical protein
MPQSWGGECKQFCITANSWFCSNWLIQKNVHIMILQLLIYTKECLPNAHWALLLLPPDCVDPKGSKQQCVYWHFCFVVSFIIVKIILFVQQWVYRNSASVRVCVQYVFFCYWMKYSDHIVPDVCSFIYIQFTCMKDWTWKWCMVRQKKLHVIFPAL